VPCAKRATPCVSTEMNPVSGSRLAQAHDEATVAGEGEDAAGVGIHPDPLVPIRNWSELSELPMIQSLVALPPKRTGGVAGTPRCRG